MVISERGTDRQTGRQRERERGGGEKERERGGGEGERALAQYGKLNERAD